MNIYRNAWLAIGAAACLLPMSAINGDDGRGRLAEILKGLDQGLVALERLGRHEEHDAIERIADEVRRELEGGRDDGRELELMYEGIVEQLAGTRRELADVNEKIAELARDNQIARRTLELIAEDLERTADDDEAERRRLNRLAGDYRRRLEGGEQQLDSFGQFKARLDALRSQLEEKHHELASAVARQRRERQADQWDERIETLSRQVRETIGRVAHDDLVRRIERLERRVAELEKR